jgi:hypothetical protein
MTIYVEVRIALIAPELAHRSDNGLAVGDWCPVLYAAEARREVAPQFVADSEATDNPSGRGIAVTRLHLLAGAAGRTAS